jgi:hypothetical protein
MTGCEPEIPEKATNSIHTEFAENHKEIEDD